MIDDALLASDTSENKQFLLKAKLTALQSELNIILTQINTFEATLRLHLENQIIEEQELTVLYKKLQKEKKAKRLAQKRKGKNYTAPIGLTVSSKQISNINSVEITKEKKRLYREAMFFSHPDKFSLNHDKVDIATKITTKLIEIYQLGDYDKLKDFHAHICSGNAFLAFDSSEKILANNLTDNYLENEITEIEKQLAVAKSKYTYKVLLEYEQPLTYVDELKAYYTNRIFKLKKRTRKA